MVIKIGRFDITECWDGIFYKKLSDYPDITTWEIQNVLDFIRYEESNGRMCAIEAEDSILDSIDRYRPTYNAGVRLSPPTVIRECTACPKYKGCMTDLVCHTSPLDSAVKILECGKLLSPVLARGLSPKELRSEKRNAAGDPEDYFDYIMFSWGNCQAGDRLVTERKLGRFPTGDDLCPGFTPGVRFFFRYEDLIRHPEATYDGVLPIKVKNQVVLKDYISSIISPDRFQKELEPYIPKELETKVHFLSAERSDIWEWSERVYEYAKALA